MGFIADSIRVRHDPGKPAAGAKPVLNSNAKKAAYDFADCLDDAPYAVRAFAAAELLSRGFSWCDWDAPNATTWSDIYDRLRAVAQALEERGL